MMSFRYVILKDLLAFVNEQDNHRGIPIRLNELALEGDSLCMGISVDDIPEERFADVTGTAKEGKIKLEFMFRTFTSRPDDIDSMQLLYDIVEKVVSDFKLYTDAGFTSGIDWTASPRLLRVYSGNARDFVSKITISYERMVH